MDLKLERNPDDGTITRMLGENRVPLILKGGWHSIFEETTENHGTPAIRCLVRPGETLPFGVEHKGHEPCQNGDLDHAPCQNAGRFEAAALNWDSEDSEPDPWGNLFQHMVDFDCSFLRVWLTGGMPVRGTGDAAEPLFMTPFRRRKVGVKWKWRVYDAIVNHLWNGDYFRRLKRFATEAQKRGIVLQISLFNYVDMDADKETDPFRRWSMSPYNPEACDNWNWAKNHLVYIAPEDIPDDPNQRVRQRQERFIKPMPGNNLRSVVQKEIVKKVIRELGAHTNIIYEIMNEPRSLHKAVAEFSSAVTGWINEEQNIRQPLITVNAANFDGTNFDIDYWRDAASIRHYDRIDAISYHGISGTLKKGGFCGVSKDIALVDKRSINERYEEHKNSHRRKSLIHCTDGAYLGDHFYPGTRPGENQLLRVRDGQISTDYPNAGLPGATKLQESKKSDLENWAYWCFLNAIPNAGRVHFQNHSMNQVSYRRIRNAYRDADAAV